MLRRPARSRSIPSPLLAVLLLVACGGGGDETSTATEAPTAQRLALTPAQAAHARWDAPVKLPLVPASGGALANGKLLLWSADSKFDYGTTLGRTYTILYDPATGTSTERLVTETGHDMFCPGTARLADGRLLVNGGYEAANTSFFDTDANTWTRGPLMKIPRGYNTSVGLPDGSALTLGGSLFGGGGNKDGEIWSPETNTWRKLANVPDDPFLLYGRLDGYPSDSHFSLIPTGNGRVLFAGPAVQMQWIDTTGEGQVTPAGRRGDDVESYAGGFVMFEAGKILKVGGGPWVDGQANNRAYVIDTTRGTAEVRKVAPMAYPRVFHSVSVLPNGQVMVVGGQTYGLPFSDNYAVMVPELFDPQTGTFTPLAPMKVPRTYHSIGMLMPDGRVMAAGGALSSGSGVNHPDIEVLNPPYLYNADGTPATRPVITRAGTRTTWGARLPVTTDSPIASFAMVRLGATTHSVDNDQRRIAIPHVQTGDNSYELLMPTNAGHLLPGQWMLFAMNAQGTPSVSAPVHVDHRGAPTLAPAPIFTATLGKPFSGALTGSTPTGSLAWSASGLPAGMAIDPATGTITGTATSAGSHVVIVSATNGTHTVSTEVLLDVTRVGTGTGLLGQ